MSSKFAFFLACGAPLCLAQFSNLSTTTSGNRVFFVTTLRQPGLNQYPHEKLFVLDLIGSGANLPTATPVADPVTGVSTLSLLPSNISLVFQRARTGGLFFSNGFAPADVTATADGRYVAFTTYAGCQGGSSCLFRELASGSVMDVNSGQSVFDGLRTRVSRNGRYFLSQPTSEAPASTVGPIRVLDRTTNETRDITAAPVIALSSTGDVLLNEYSQGTRLLRWDGTTRDFPVTGAVAMDDAETTIVFGNGYGTSDQARLFVYDIASGRKWQLGPDDRASYSPSFSDDGQWVLYLTNLGGVPQLMLSHPDGSAWKQMSAELAGVNAGTLSGDGQVAWAATADGRLLRIPVSGGTQTVLDPPWFTNTSWQVEPGSLVRLNGYRLGTTVQIEDMAAPVVAATSNEVDAQAPWDLAQPDPDSSGMRYLVISSSRSDSPLEAVTREYSANWAAYYPQSWAIVHQDWSALVSDENPAIRGEVLHVYATGLGATNCTVATGQPAPVDRACLPARTIDWTWWWTSTDSVPAEVAFAGLAPGLTGLYQIDVTVPVSLVETRFKLIADRNGNYVVADISFAQACDGCRPGNPPQPPQPTP